MVVGENKRPTNIMDGIENTGDVRLHDHRLRLKQRFDIVRKLGQGTYGKVQLGINKKTGQEVAIKTIKKCKIETEADLVRIRREVQIMSSVRHPNIVHIYEVFENSEKMILVMEYCSGGELYDYLSQKKVLEEDEARRLFRQIATAVYYCHIHKICHRDLKLENVLLDDTGSAKIADFGLSNVFKESSVLSTFCGSPLYASPEIVKGTPYIGPEVDCWSLGVLLYTLVYGAMPFDGSNFKRLVRQISNGDYYEPKNPSSASPLIRDMLTVDPAKRADIVYICDHPWVNSGASSCLEMAQDLAQQTPVRLDLLLSLAVPAAGSLVLPEQQPELNRDESCTDLTSSTLTAVEPSNSAEKRILELVAEGGEDAIKPSPTRTIVSAGDNKRKLELAMSASGLQRKKERVNSTTSLIEPPVLPEETPPPSPPEEPYLDEAAAQPLKSSATMTISPAPIELAKDRTQDIVREPQEQVKQEKTSKVKSQSKVEDTEKAPDKEEVRPEEPKQSSVASAADKLTSLSLAQPSPAAPVTKPKKFSIPGGNVGNFKEQFERRASLTSPPEVKKTVSKPVVSKIAKPKAQSEDRELPNKIQENNSVRLQQIGIEPSQTQPNCDLQPNARGVKSRIMQTESEPSHGSPVDPSVLLQDARRRLLNSMSELAEEKATEENKRRAARDIISTAIRTGKPPVPYGRSSSAGVTSLTSPPGTPPVSEKPRVFRTELHHKVDDHRNRGTSVERIIPIQMSKEEESRAPSPPKPAASHTLPRASHTPVRRLPSNESTVSESSTTGEPIKKSAREFIIPIAVEGKGYVTPRQGSLEPEASGVANTRLRTKPRRISSLVSGGESEGEEDESHMHRLRSSRAARAESVSSGEEDEEDEGFHLLTAENLFSTLLHRVRALTNRLNGEEGPGFSQHPHSLFNNLHMSPFFNSPHLPRRNLLREGWGSRDLHADFDSMFNKPRQQMPRDESREEGGAGEVDEAVAAVQEGVGVDAELGALGLDARAAAAVWGLTPGLARRLQRELMAQLPARAARTLRRTLSLNNAPAPAPPPPPPDRPVLTKYLPRRRSRFLRADFEPTDNYYLKHRQEKELETQQILKEIREKRSKTLERAESNPAEPEEDRTHKCLTPPIKDRSRSNTPFFPLLGNIKETAPDSSSVKPDAPDSPENMSPNSDVPSNKESKLARPKSYPVKTTLESYEETPSTRTSENFSYKKLDAREASLPRESKLLRPKSYPTTSPSPEKVFINRKIKKDDPKISPPKQSPTNPDNKNDVEVSFSITLPRKSKLSKSESLKKNDEPRDLKSDPTSKASENNLTLKKYQIVNSEPGAKPEHKEPNIGNGVTKVSIAEPVTKSEGDETKIKVTNHASKKEEVKLKPVEPETTDKKGTIKKKIIRKVSSKSKADSNNTDSSETKPVEKKKVTKKIKEKTADDSTKTVVKKKSMLQSIGQKLEKLTTKSSSPEKSSDNSVVANNTKKDSSKLSRLQREQSVPVAAEPPTESNLIKRAVTLTDVAAMDVAIPNKNAVSKVLGLFKKFEPKDKSKTADVKDVLNGESSYKETNFDVDVNSITTTEVDPDKDKPKRPTSLLLNGLGRKNRYLRATSDTTAVLEYEDATQDKENNKEDKSSKNSIKLDFSRLPRVKKIVPTNPVIEPQIMDLTSTEKEIEKKGTIENNGRLQDGSSCLDSKDIRIRSRSRSRSTFSNSELKSDLSGEYRDRGILSPTDAVVHHPFRNHEPTSPDKEDIVDRIRRKSFYTRFNEKKQRRKSSLVGPGAAEYDPVARIHAPPETKYDASPSSPNSGSYDLSSSYNLTSDVTSPTERYRSLLTDLNPNTRSNLRYDTNYGLNDKIDTYRSLDRNDFRKYPGSRSYLDYDQPLSYGTSRYSRTKSLLDSADGVEDSVLGHTSNPHKYNRTISMYSPGSYATYRPKRTRNSAIILKESEKEPSPENILEKIRQRKSYTISVTRKPDPEKDPPPRSNFTPKSEGDGTERSQKAD